MYVSITRLKLRSIWSLAKFGRQSNLVARQAKAAPGNLMVKLSNRWFNTFYTITHWNSKEAMQQFMINGEHKKAMQQWAVYASEVKVYGFETMDPPTWKEARLMVENKGRITTRHA
ncbi:MAG: hypothetical protein ABJF11_04335 [Reichenbachiella sp.]|uniref:hypothetical protein n=1 Tax=Reichenbachiella sp. TaxID=2184521 RepID=UPI003267C969